ncbi:hypothetical protein LINPERHAP1_LOCUS22802 [Linum perenne]
MSIANAAKSSSRKYKPPDITVGESAPSPIKIVEKAKKTKIDISEKLKSKYRLWRRVRRVEYEGLHVICFNCGIYGHSKDACPHKLATKNEEEIIPKNMRHKAKFASTKPTEDSVGHEKAKSRGSQFEVLAEQTLEPSEAIQIEVPSTEVELGKKITVGDSDFDRSIFIKEVIIQDSGEGNSPTVSLESGKEKGTKRSS